MNLNWGYADQLYLNKNNCKIQKCGIEEKPGAIITTIQYKVKSYFKKKWVGVPWWRRG